MFQHTPFIRALVVCTGLVSLCLAGASLASSLPLPTVNKTQQKIAAMSVPFVPNQGQWDTQAAFAAKTFAGTQFVTTDGKIVYSLPAATDAARDARGWSLSESFVSANGDKLKATPHGYRPAEAKVSYFIGGDPSKHQAAINTYDRVNLGDVFKGINVQLRATGSNVEKIFTVAPQQDPTQIKVKLEGATKLEVGAQGELIAHTDNGPVTYTAPIAFQQNADGKQQNVEVSYALNAATQTYGFTLGAYDQTQPLVIDPLLQSTYLGGNGNDFTFAVAVHPHTGEVYVAGNTTATNFPNTVGGGQNTKSTNSDATVARFNASLTALLQASYFGGTGEESAYALAIHPASGDVYIAGTTTSPTLPQSAGSAQSASGGGQDVFVALFNRTLTALQRSSLLGGSGFDDISFGTALAVHPLNGDVYVVGITESGNFPVGLGAAQPTYAGSGDAFVTRFNPALTARVQSSYLGGVGEDRGGALCISPTTGDVYVGGSTVSSPFPATAGGAQAAFAGNSDGFVSRLNEALSSVLQSSYFGGNGRDTVFALAVDRSTGDILAAGQTNSSALPQMNGAAQTIPGSSFDGFVVRFNASLKSIVRSTFVGGTGAEELYAMAVHPVTGEIFVAGASTGGLTQTAAGVQPNAAGGKDGFVLSLNGALSAVQQATYYGGTGADDYVRGIALHPTAPEVYIAGYTFSTNFAVSPPSGGAQSARSGPSDGFVARLSTDLTAVNRAPNAMSFIAQSNVPAGSRRTANEVQMVISPNPGSNQPAYITGSASSDMCVTDTPGCCTNVSEICSGFVSGWILGPYSFLSGDYIAVRHNAASPSGTAVTNLITGGVAFPFVTSTGNAALRCNLDVNGDNKLLATVEGLMLVRAMLGLGADAIVAGTGVAAWEPYRVQLNANCGTNFPFSASPFQ